MKVPFKFAIIKVDALYDEQTGYKGVDGKPIISNHLFNPERHVRTYGEVVAIPDMLPKSPLVSDALGFPNYEDIRPRLPFKPVSDIKMEVQVGDKIHFHRHVVQPDRQDVTFNALHIKTEVVDGKKWYYYMCKYDLIFAVVRKGKIIPIGSYVLIEPDFESWDDISIPTPETINGKVLLDKNMRPKMKPKDQWIVTKSAPGHNYLCGTVKHTGSALIGDKEFLKPGDYVFFQRSADTVAKIEGVNYFRVRQRHIIGKATKKLNTSENNES